MDWVQTMEDAVDVLPAPRSGLGVVLRKPDGVSRSFLLAVGLHLAAVMALGLSIRYWPAVPTPVQPGHLELDLESSPPPLTSQVLPEPPALLDQALASVPEEARSGGGRPAPVPEVRGAPLPEPAVTVSPAGGARETSMPATYPVDAGVLDVLSPPARPAAIVQRVHGGGHPTALSEIQPHYPYAARTRGEEGQVTVHVQVSESGKVAAVRIGESSGFPALDESALSAARKAFFKPAEQAGRPVPSEINLRFDFRLQD